MAITNGYSTLAELKGALGIPSSDTASDSALELSIESASRQIDSHCERVFYQTIAATRVFTPNDYDYVEIDDLYSLTSLKTSTDADGGFDQTWSSPTDYQLEPLNGRAGGIVSPATGIRAVGDLVFPNNGAEATVQVVGNFGWSAVPTEIKMASLILAGRLWKRFDSVLGVAGFGPDLGIVRVSRFDPDIAALTDPYKRIRFA
jgi:hypothetical protein